MTPPAAFTKPVIGVTALHGDDDWVHKNTANYLRVLRQRGVHPVVLAPDAPARFPDGRVWHPDQSGALPEAILAEIDGVVVSGGGDVHPSHFGQEIDGAETDRIDPKRDVQELTLTRSALRASVPIFGICRGFQVLNVAAGGSLIQHFDGHRSPENDTAYHEVSVRPNSRLHTAVSGPALRVNTYHHQGVNLAGLAPGFVATGMASPDSWLVEAIESTNGHWALGVQWHPERDFELSAAHGRIWDNFIVACNQRRTARLR
jgi:putative glutamine amidotransferase